MNKTKTLYFKPTLLTLGFLLPFLCRCGMLTCFNQMEIYRQERGMEVGKVGAHLANLIAAEGEDFAMHQ